MLHARSDQVTAIIGSCTGCGRRVGGQYVRADIPGVVAAHGDGKYCDACAGWLRRNPDGNLDEACGPAQKVPAERPIADWTWRTRAACRGADFALFDVALDVLDPDDRAFPIPSAARAAADEYCLFCPVADQCREEADLHRYEGLFGGVWRWTRYGQVRDYRSVDLLAQLQERVA